jgi:hypothetical protein
MAWVRKVLVALGAGLTTAVAIGLSFGTLDRLLMRVIAHAAGERPSFNLGATTAILIAITVLNLPAAVAFAASARRAWIGYLLAIAGTAPHLVNLAGTASVYGEAPGQPNLALFVLAYALYASSLAAMVLLTAKLGRRLGQAWSGAGAGTRTRTATQTQPAGRSG